MLVPFFKTETCSKVILDQQISETKRDRIKNVRGREGFGEPSGESLDKKAAPDTRNGASPAID
jgi:hypothetical protein